MEKYHMDFELRNKKFRVEVKADLKCYHLGRVDEFDERISREIPCMTRAEENAYPKDAAWVATGFLRGLQQAIGKEAGR